MQNEKAVCAKTPTGRNNNYYISMEPGLDRCHLEMSVAGILVISVGIIAIPVCMPRDNWQLHLQSWIPLNFWSIHKRDSLKKRPRWVDGKVHENNRFILIKKNLNHFGKLLAPKLDEQLCMSRKWHSSVSSIQNYVTYITFKQKTD